MSTNISALNTSIEQFGEDMDLTHQWVHGGSGATVTLGGVETPTVKNVVGQVLSAGGAIAYQTKAALDLDLAHDANTLAFVTNDSDTTKIGWYIKVGASGTGSWQMSSYDRTVTQGQLVACLRSAGRIYSAAGADAAGITDIDALPPNSILTFTAVIDSIAHKPFDSSGYTILTMSPEDEIIGGAFQIAASKDGVVKQRMAWGNPVAWTEWKHAVTEDDFPLLLHGAGKISSADDAEAAGFTDIDSLPPNTILTFSVALDAIANKPFDSGGYTILTASPTGGIVGGAFQQAVFKGGIVRHRVAWGNPAEWGGWSEAAAIEDAGRINSAGHCTARDIAASFSSPGFINYSNGAYSTYGSGTYRATDFLPVVEGETLEAKRCTSASSANDSGLAFYDSQKAFLSGVQWQAADATGFAPAVSMQVPEGACYVRLTIREDCTETFSVRTYGPQRDGVLEQLAFRTVSDGPLLRGIPHSLIDCFLTMGCIGDSITAGSCYYGPASGVAMPEHSWPSVLARATGNTYRNFAIGGIRTDNWLTSEKAAECYDGQHLCTGYIVALGINDYNYMNSEGLDPETFIGSTADINTSDYTLNADTFCGRYGKIIQKIQEVQPKAKIFVCTSYRDAQETSGFNDAIRSIPAVLQNVYLLDLKTWFDKAFNGGIINKMLRSGHFNAVGYHEIAFLISSCVDWVIRKNPTEFREIEFIGTDYSYYD